MCNINHPTLFCTGADQQSGKSSVWQSIGEGGSEAESRRSQQDTSKTKPQEQELSAGPPLQLRLKEQRPFLTRPDQTIRDIPAGLLLYQVFLILVYKLSSILFVPSV